MIVGGTQTGQGLALGGGIVMGAGQGTLGVSGQFGVTSSTAEASGNIVTSTGAAPSVGKLDMSSGAGASGRGGQTCISVGTSMLNDGGSVLVSSLVKPKFASSAQNLLGRAHDSLQVRAWTTVESLTLFLVEGPACPVVASSSFGRERRRQIHIAPTYTCAQQRRQQTMAGAWGYTLATALVLLAASAASRAKVATDVWETSCSFLGQAKYPQVP